MNYEALTDELARGYAALHDAAHSIRQAARLADGAAGVELGALSRAVDLEVDALVVIARRHIRPELLAH